MGDAMLSAIESPGNWWIKLQFRFVASDSIWNWMTCFFYYYFFRFFFSWEDEENANEFNICNLFVACISIFIYAYVNGRDVTLICVLVIHVLCLQFNTSKNNLDKTEIVCFVFGLFFCFQNNKNPVSYMYIRNI